MSNLITKEEYKERLIEIIDIAVKEGEKVLKFKEMLEDKSNYGDNYHTSLGNMSFDIKSTGETAYQRAILKVKNLLDFKENKSFETVEWIDGELPIVLNENRRRIAIDLIGLLNGKPTICELKYKKSSKKSSNSNSPVYAAIELLTYYCFIQFNAEALDKYSVNHKNLKSFKWNVITGNRFPHLIVCANESYWDSWFRKYNKKELINKVHKWGKQLDISISLFQSEDFDFELQRVGNKDKYTPSIPDKSIWKIV